MSGPRSALAAIDAAVDSLQSAGVIASTIGLNEARAAFAELVAAVKDNDSGCPCAGCERIRNAVARVDGGAS